MAGTEAVQKWASTDSVQGKPIYFVVGYLTITDAQVVIDGSEGVVWSHGWRISYQNVGDRFLAVKYRKVQFKRFSGKDIATASIGESCWQTYICGGTHDLVLTGLGENEEAVETTG